MTTSLTMNQCPTKNSEHNQNVMTTDHHIRTQSYYQSRLVDQLRNCETEHAALLAANWEENGELVQGINIFEQINAHMQTDDNENEARIVSIYHMLTIHDPEILSVPEDDENNQNISTRDALKEPDAEQFKEAIRKKVWDLTKGTGTLVPGSTEEVKAMKKYWQIGTTLKCKRKKKGNGLPDKHKARGAVRGDQLVAKILCKGLPMPHTFSPTVKPLIFAFIMQIAVTLDCIWCTADIKSAYLNIPRPTGEIPILTELEPFVAEICDLPVQNQQVPLRVTRLWTPLLPTLSRRFNRRRVCHEQDGQLSVLPR